MAGEGTIAISSFEVRPGAGRVLQDGPRRRIHSVNAGTNPGEGLEGIEARASDICRDRTEVGPSQARHRSLQGHSKGSSYRAKLDSRHEEESGGDSKILRGPQDNHFSLPCPRARGRDAYLSACNELCVHGHTRAVREKSNRGL